MRIVIGFVSLVAAACILPFAIVFSWSGYLLYCASDWLYGN